MVIALSHRYCCAAINHSLSRMLSSCCNKPVIVWNKVLLFVINPLPLCVAMIFFCGWIMNQCITQGLLKICVSSPCVTVTQSVIPLCFNCVF